MTLQLLSKQQERPEHDSKKEEDCGVGRPEGLPGAKTDQEELMQHSPARGAVCSADPREVSTDSMLSGHKGESAPPAAEARMPEEEQAPQSSGVLEEEEVQQESLSSGAECCLNADKGPELAEQAVTRVDEDFVLTEQKQESSPIKKTESEHSPFGVSLQAEVADPSFLETKPEVDVAVLADKPVAEQEAEEPMGGLEPPPLSSEGENCTDPSDGAGSDQEPASVSNTEEKSSPTTREVPQQQELGSSPSQKGSR